MSLKLVFQYSSVAYALFSGKECVYEFAHFLLEGFCFRTSASSRSYEDVQLLCIFTKFLLCK
jgi:hypothetical protein